MKTGTLVGVDKLGNKYYENRAYFYGEQYLKFTIIMHVTLCKLLEESVTFLCFERITSFLCFAVCKVKSIDVLYSTFNSQDLNYQYVLYYRVISFLTNRQQIVKAGNL